MGHQRSSRDESTPGTQAKLRFLRSRAAHPGIDGPIEAIETHMSWVVLAGDRALKLKKPVRTRLLDFSTVAARERNAREELRLNLRLAPQVYLGLLALQWHDRRFRLVSDTDLPAAGRTVDWLVLMRRLPAKRMLDHVIGEGRVTRADIDALIDVLAPFYRSAARATLGPDAYLARFRREQARNREVLLQARFVLADAAPALDAFDTALRTQTRSLRQRVLQQRLVDGHGDLRPEHVCLLRPPVVIDGLEFDASLRQVDPFDEVEFLALECEMAGAPRWLGPHLLARCAAALDDSPPPALLQLYAASRALLRARLAAAHLLDAQPRTPQEWLPRARRYLARALQALQAMACTDAGGFSVARPHGSP
jgi:aminoglycoside phosphotransferase family enzyme